MEGVDEPVCMAVVFLVLKIASFEGSGYLWIDDFLDIDGSRYRINRILVWIYRLYMVY